MKIRHLKLLFPLLLVASGASAEEEPVELTIDTDRIYVAPSEYLYTGLEIYDSTGAFYGSAIGTLTQQGIHTQALFDFQKEFQSAGIYYLSIVGDDGKRYWTNAQTITFDSGHLSTVGSGSISAEGFPNSTIPVAVAENQIAGNQVITGYLDLEGSMFKMGTSPIAASEPAFVLSVEPDFSDASGLASPRVIQINRASTNNARWKWEDQLGRLAMQLDGEGSLHVTKLFAGNVLDRNASAFSFSSVDSHSIRIDSSSAAGQHLTLEAGGAGGIDKAGGTLFLSAGSSTGSAGSAIEFKTATGGNSGSLLQSPQTRMKINVSGGVEAGDSLVATGHPQFVVGKFNDTRTNDEGTDHTQGLFIVGDGPGTGDTPRTNAMRILPDGTVLIQERGDVSMGSFKAGPRP